MPVENPQSRVAAKRRAEAKLAFYAHLGLWTVVSLGLIVLNVATSTYPWAVWPVLGWGSAVFLHGARTFKTRSRILDRMIDAELERASE